jgi:hypothetical protein
VIVIKPASPAFGGVVTFVNATLIDLTVIGLTSSTHGRWSILARVLLGRFDPRAMKPTGNRAP